MGRVLGHTSKWLVRLYPVPPDNAKHSHLRGFGVAPRTWLHKLSYDRRDRILIAVSVTVFLLSTVLSILGWGKFWVPGWLLQMAGT